MGQNVRMSEEFINFGWNDEAGFGSVLHCHLFSFCATVGIQGLVFAGRFAGFASTHSVALYLPFSRSEKYFLIEFSSGINFLAL